MGIHVKQLGVFNGLTPSEKNKEFVTARFTVAECYKGNILPASMLNRPNIVVPFNLTKNEKLIASLNTLTIDNLCIIEMDVDIEQANAGYKAKLKFELIDCKPQDKKAA